MGHPFRVTAHRRICADPTSTALLLAGPGALDLWPGLRRIGDGGCGVLVEADVPRGPHVQPMHACVKAFPPQRTPTSFVTRFAFSGDGVPETRGELRLFYAAGGPTATTAAELTLDCSPPAGVALLGWEGDTGVLHQMADEFLDNLAAAAEQRSYAA